MNDQAVHHVHEAEDSAGSVAANDLSRGNVKYRLAIKNQGIPCLR